jgi:RNA polymerase sigma-70 factor (ECF subfamily)
MDASPTPPSLETLLRHEAFVRAAARAVLGGDAEVDDVVQETWRVALGSGPRDPRRARAWLGGVARRLARLVVRRRVRARRREAAAARPEGTPSAAEVAAREETRARLVRALLALEEPSRSAVLLRYHEGLAPRVIARRLGVPVETVKTRIHRGLTRLRARLGEGTAPERRRRGAGLAALAGLTRGGSSPGPAGVAVAALLLAAAGTWFLLRGSGAAPPPQGAGRGIRAQGQPAPERPGPTLTGRAPAAAGAPARAAPLDAGTMGRVLDAAGHPVAGAIVSIRSSLPQRMLDMQPLPWHGLLARTRRRDLDALHAARVRTDAGGRFHDRAPAVAGSAVLVLSGAHPPLALSSDPAARRADGVLDLGTLRLPEGATLRVVVLDEDGRPLPDAAVAVQPPDGRDRGGVEREDLVRATTTDATGAATLAGLTPGPVLVGAWDTRHPVAVERLHLAPGTRRDLTLRLVAGRTLRVAVRSEATGAPVAGARVDAAASADPAGEPLATGRTDAEGVVRLGGLPAGPWWVTVAPPDHAGAAVARPPPFSVTRKVAGAADLEVELAWTTSLELDVAPDAEGQRPHRLLVLALPEGDFDRARGRPAAQRLTLPVDDRGVARVPGLRPGRWRLRGFARDHLPFDLRVEVVAGSRPPARTLELERASGRAGGRVVDSAGRPVAHAVLGSYEWVAWLGDGQRAATTSGADGRFALAPLLGPGTPLLVRVEAGGYLPLERRVDADHRDGDLGDLHLLRPGRIAGTWAPPGSRVQAWQVGVRPRGKPVAVVARADADGRFVLRGLAPGRWRVRAEDGRRDEVDVAEGTEARARLAP